MSARPHLPFSCGPQVSLGVTQLPDSRWILRCTVEPGHWNTGKFDLHVKKILLPVISFPGMVTLSPWEKEGKALVYKPGK